MTSMKEITCRCGCGKKRMVRTADVNRGWGLFFSKSCKAKSQERRTGQHAAYLHSKGKEDRQQWLLNNIDKKLKSGHSDNDSWNFDDMDGHFSNETSNQF